MSAPIGSKCLEGLADIALQGRQHQLDRPSLVGRFAPIFWDRTGIARAAAHVLPAYLNPSVLEPCQTKETSTQPGYKRRGDIERGSAYLDRDNASITQQHAQ